MQSWTFIFLILDFGKVLLIASKKISEGISDFDVALQNYASF